MGCWQTPEEFVPSQKKSIAEAQKCFLRHSKKYFKQQYDEANCEINEYLFHSTGMRLELKNYIGIEKSNLWKSPYE